MLVSLFAIMSMAVSAGIIEYSTDDGFRYGLDTEAKTVESNSKCKISHRI